MVMKEYCDECGKELKAGENKVSDRITFKSKSSRHKFQVLATDDNETWNAGSLCLECIKKLIANSE